jgi:hypothetical protein
LIVSQTLTLYVTPVFYIYMEKLQEWLAKRKMAAAESTPHRVEPSHGDLGGGTPLAPQRRH